MAVAQAESRLTKIIDEERAVHGERLKEKDRENEDLRR
jgi:hypothetical protein